MQCKECQSELQEGAKFCMNCGTPLQTEQSSEIMEIEQDQSTDRGTRGSQQQTGKTKFFYGKAKYLKDTVKVTERFLISKALITQVLESGIETILQGKKKPNFLRQAAGLDQAVTVNFSTDGNDLKATIGGAKWVDKAVGAGIGMLVFAPALLTAGWGIYQQQKLYTQIESEIVEFLKTKP